MIINSTVNISNLCAWSKPLIQVRFYLHPREPLKNPQSTKNQIVAIFNRKNLNYVFLKLYTRMT